MQLDLVEPDEVAKELKVTPGTLAKWRVFGGGPRFVKYGKNVMYDSKDVSDWLESRKMRTTSDKK